MYYTLTKTNHGYDVEKQDNAALLNKDEFCFENELRSLRKHLKEVGCFENELKHFTFQTQQGRFPDHEVRTDDENVAIDTNSKGEASKNIPGFHIFSSFAYRGDRAKSRYTIIWEPIVTLQ